MPLSSFVDVSLTFTRARNYLTEGRGEKKGRKADGEANKVRQNENEDETSASQSMSLFNTLFSPQWHSSWLHVAILFAHIHPFFNDLQNSRNASKHIIGDKFILRSLKAFLGNTCPKDRRIHTCLLAQVPSQPNTGADTLNGIVSTPGTTTYTGIQTASKN